MVKMILKKLKVKHFKDPLLSNSKTFKTMFCY